MTPSGRRAACPESDNLSGLPVPGAAAQYVPVQRWASRAQRGMAARTKIGVIAEGRSAAAGVPAWYAASREQDGPCCGET